MKLYLTQDQRLLGLHNRLILIPKHRLIHDFNNTAYGYALPASIGAKLANQKFNVTCLVGDKKLYDEYSRIINSKRI